MEPATGTVEGVGVNVSRDFWRGRRVFVTGHTGFKGSWLCLWLQRLGAEVTGYALEPATQPSLFEAASVARGMRSIIGDMALLVPGIGAQGGDIEATVQAGQTVNGGGMMINSSRAILYAKPQGDEDYAQAAARVARETRDAINRFRNAR